MIKRFHSFLTAPLDKTSRGSLIFWLSLSMTFAGSYAILALKKSFEFEYLVQDDARQHVFWMGRFLDPSLFPNDLIADYFQSVAPVGYQFVYQIPALFGIEPLFLAKIIPLILTLVCTYYSFSVCLEILPVPLAGFITTLVMNQAIWMKDDVASATPRAFIYPIFMAFLYYLLRKSKIGVGIAIALIASFYPQYVFVASGMLVVRLMTWQNGRLQLLKNAEDLGLSAVGLGVGFLMMLPYALTSSEYGPAISRAEAMKLREFFPDGRSTFFHYKFSQYWLTGKRSGMFPSSLFTPATQCAMFLFPLVLVFRRVFPLVQQLKSGIWVLLHLFMSSVAMFFIAHAVLFKLHLPSRYTGLSFRIIVALMAAITLTLIIDGLLTGLETASRSEQGAKFNVKLPLVLGTISLIFASLIFYPAFVKEFPSAKYKVGQEPELYEFLQKQPKDTLIASLEEEANQIPTFTQRSILVGREYAIPYQVGYYRQFQERAFDLIQAQYSDDLSAVKNFIQKYQIDLWMLHRSAFTPQYLEANGWINQYEPSQDAIQALKKGEKPALMNFSRSCQVFENLNFIILDTNCVLKGRG